jgi:hypothetical protein
MHFITVLEQPAAILASYVQLSNTVKKQDHLAKDKGKKEKLVNMFDNLGLEDISSSSEDTPISTQTTVKSPTFNTRPNV